MAGTDPPAGEPHSSRAQRRGAGADFARQLAKGVLEEDARENSRRNPWWESFKRLLQRVRGRFTGSGGESAEGSATPSASGTGRPESGNDQSNPWLRQGRERTQGAGAPAPGAREQVDGMSPAEREPVRAAMLELIQESPRLQKLYFNGKLPAAEALLDGPDPHPAPRNAREAENLAQAQAPGQRQARGQAPAASSQTGNVPGPAQAPIMVQTGSNSSVVVNVTQAASQVPLPAMPTGEARRSLDAAPGREQSGRSVPGSKATPQAKRPAQALESGRPTKRARGAR